MESATVSSSDTVVISTIVTDIFNSSVVDYNDTTNVTQGSPVEQPSLDDFLKPYWTYNVALQMYRIYPFVLFSIGLIGNSLALAVFLQKKMRKYSSYIYLAGLAIFDNLALTCQMLSAIAGTFYYPDISTVGFCKVITFLQSWAHHVTSWLVVMVTVERLIATAIPLKAAILCTPKRATIVVISVILVSAAIDLHSFWTITSATNPTRCVVPTDSRDFYEKWSWIDISLYSFIPSILLFVFNIIIVYFMKTAWNRQRRLTNNKNKVPRGVFSKQITVVLILVSVTFLVFTLPASSVFLYRFITNPQKRAIVEGRWDIYAEFIYINQIAGICFLLNHCFNILLYSMSGRRFRHELMNILRCRCGALERRRQGSSSTNNVSTFSSESSSKGMPNDNSCRNGCISGFTNKAFKGTSDEKMKYTQKRQETNNISLSKGFKSGSYNL